MDVLEWVVLAVWVSVFFRTIVNLRLLPRLHAAGTADGPLVSVVIPARNEERSIERTVRAFLSQSWSSVEVVVIDDRSTDSTPAILSRIARDDPRLRVITGSETPDGWLGKPWALQQGSAEARGEILLFVDADILYQRDAVAAAANHLQASGAAMLALLPSLVMESFWERVVMPQLAMVVYSLLPTWLANKTTIRVLGVGGGTGNMIWRRDYDAVGGHAALRDAVIDDVGLARLVRRSGRRTAVVRAEEMVSVRMYEGGREIIEGFTKNTFAVFDRSYFATVIVTILGIVFHIVPYVLAVAGRPVAIAAVAFITLTRVLLFASLGYRLHYALWAHPLMMIVWTWITLRSMWITGVRKRLAWRGRSYDARRTRFGA